MSRLSSNTALLPPEKPAPLETMANLLADDMAATNDMILARLQSPVTLIPQVAEHLIQSGGKRIRPLLTLAGAAMYNERHHNAHKLAAAVEFIHSASLLHDDVVDNSDERRGQAAAQTVFGNKAAVLVGDFLFSRAFELMVETHNVRVLELLSHASTIITEGEVLQLKTANNIATTMNDYMQVIGAKTAALFAAAAAVGPALANAPRAEQDALYAYGHHLGVAFQIADDVLDYVGEEQSFGKQQGNDFYEGKMTAPVIFAVQFGGDTEHAFWARTMAGGATPDDFLTAREYLLQHDAFAKAHHLADEQRDCAIDALDDVPDSELRRILADLASYAVTRQA